VNGRKSLFRVEISLRHMDKYFGSMRVNQITTTHINQYIEARLAEGAANATINRELAGLKRMLSLGATSTPPKVQHIPHGACQ